MFITGRIRKTCRVIKIVVAVTLSSLLNAQDYSAIRTMNEDSVVFIHSKKSRKDGAGIPEQSYGTGFLISNLGYVLTASHVVLKSDADTIVETEGAIRSRYNPKYKLEYIKRDDEIDAALLIFPDVGLTWRPVIFGDSNSVPKDAPLYTLGFPGTSDLSPATGILSNRFGPRGTWQTTLTINRGNSGGPVFDLAGKVVAVASAGTDEYQAITFVTPATHTFGLRQLATLIFPTGPVDLPTAVPSIVQTFRFYQAVDHEEQRAAREQYCLPAGYIVTKVDYRITTQNGPATTIRSAEPDSASPGCVVLEGFIGGAGVDKIGPIVVNFRGRGWLGAEVVVHGTKKQL